MTDRYAIDVRRVRTFNSYNAEVSMRKRQATINARIPEDLRRRIDEYAAHVKLRPSRVLEKALVHYLNEVAPIPPPPIQVQSWDRPAQGETQ